MDSTLACICTSVKLKGEVGMAAPKLPNKNGRDNHTHSTFIRLLSHYGTCIGLGLGLGLGNIAILLQY